MTPEIHVAANQPTDPTSRRRSGWAIASLVSGCIACPPFPFIAPILGLWALVTLQRRPGMRGHAMATIGIILGLVVSSFWVALIIGVRGPLTRGPVDAIRAGMGGDVESFRDGLGGDAASTNDDEANAFLQELQSRYGLLIACTTDEFRSPEGGPWEVDGMRIPYRFVFEQAEVDATVQVRIRGLSAEYIAIHVLDPILGNMYFPMSSDPEAVEITDPPQQNPGPDDPRSDPTTDDDEGQR